MEVTERCWREVWSIAHTFAGSGLRTYEEEMSSALSAKDGEIV